MDASTTTQLLEAIIAVIMAILAWWKARQVNEVEAQVQALTPGTVESKTPEIVSKLPGRSWKMNDATKRWLTFDADQETKQLILDQIADAESQSLTHYQIHFPGGYYVIDYGLLMGGAGNPHDVIGSPSDVKPAAPPAPAPDKPPGCV